MRRSNYQHVSVITLYSILLFILSLGLCGCAAAQNPAQAEPAAQAEAVTDRKPLLPISAKGDLSAGSTVISFEDAGGNFKNEIQYLNVADVAIELDGTQFKLEDTLRNGLITEEEIFCYARLDARNGFCQEEVQSKNGLTHFTYRYPECNIRLIYDIYETPDGQQHLISDMVIYPHDVILGAYTDFLNEDTYEYLDREDWGLAMEAKDVSPSGLTLHCSQTGGQQLGQLRIIQYSLTSSGQFVKMQDGQEILPSCGFALNMGGQTEITIDWSDIYGPLPAGSYQIGLRIQDEFDEASVHPLSRDYHDAQSYGISFEIP